MSDDSGETPRRRRSRLRRLALEILGWILVVAGLAALVLPGPGLLILALGLWVHSLSYEWAQRLLEPVRRQAMRAAADSVRTWPRLVLSCVGALWLMALGLLWGISPSSPSWWPLADRWWLAGGWATGVALIGSGLLALALLVWSMRQFRGVGEDVERLIDRG